MGTGNSVLPCQSGCSPNWRSWRAGERSHGSSYTENAERERKNNREILGCSQSIGKAEWTPKLGDCARAGEGETAPLESEPAGILSPDFPHCFPPSPAFPRIWQHPQDRALPGSFPSPSAASRCSRWPFPGSCSPPPGAACVPSPGQGRVPVPAPAGMRCAFGRRLLLPAFHIQHFPPHGSVPAVFPSFPRSPLEAVPGSSVRCHPLEFPLTPSLFISVIPGVVSRAQRRCRAFVFPLSFLSSSLLVTVTSFA